DKSTQALLSRGQRVTEILKQDQYQPLSVARQIAIVFAATNGYLDALPVADCRRYEKELYSFLDARQPTLLKDIQEKKDIKGELTDKLKQGLKDFAEVFRVSEKATA